METAPKIEKKHQKAEIVVTKGKDATLTVPFTATPVPKISLYYKGQLVETAKSQKVCFCYHQNRSSYIFIFILQYSGYTELTYKS